MNKNILTNLIIIIIVGVFSLSSMLAVSPTFNNPAYNYNIRNSAELLSYATVALLRKEDNKDYYTPYCSGVWIDEQYFLTAYHCIADELSEDDYKINYGTALDAYIGGAFDVHFYDPRKATVVSIDLDIDLALIKAEGDVGFHYSARFRNPQTPVGAEVHIIGHTSGLAYTYSKGYISAIRIARPFFSKRDIKIIQVDARVHKGNSGGGVFDAEGNLLGISSFLMTERYIPFFIHRDEILNFLREI